MSKDILLNDNHDIDINNFDISFTNDKELVVQKIKQALLLFKGEWFLNNNAGIPYFDEILGKNNSLNRIESLYKRELLLIPEIVEILYFNVNLDSSTRTLSINFEVIDINSNIINLTI